MKNIKCLTLSFECSDKSCHQLFIESESIKIDEAFIREVSSSLLNNQKIVNVSGNKLVKFRHYEIHEKTVQSII